MCRWVKQWIHVNASFSLQHVVNICNEDLRVHILPPQTKHFQIKYVKKVSVPGGRVLPGCSLAGVAFRAAGLPGAACSVLSRWSCFRGPWGSSGQEPPCLLGAPPCPWLVPHGHRYIYSR